jgi:hypothetical protein
MAPQIAEKAGDAGYHCGSKDSDHHGHSNLHFEHGGDQASAGA